MPEIYFMEWDDAFNPVICQPVLAGYGVLLNECQWLSNQHVHLNHAEIIYVFKGTGSVYIDGDCYKVEPGCLVCYNPRQEHQEDFRKSNETPVLYSCTFSELKIKGLPAGNVIPPGITPILQALKYNTIISACFVDMYSECCRQKLGYEKIVYKRLETIILYLLRLINEQFSIIASNNAADMLVKEAKSFIEVHYKQKISLNDVAQFLHVSPYHLSHVFTEYIGIPPMQYLISRRMNEAKRLLYSSCLSIQDISQQIGYANCSYFIMQFKKLFNISPAKYRIQMRSIDDNSNPWLKIQSPPPMDGDTTRVMYEVRRCQSTI